MEVKMDSLGLASRHSALDRALHPDLVQVMPAPGAGEVAEIAGLFAHHFPVEKNDATSPLRCLSSISNSDNIMHQHAYLRGLLGSFCCIFIFNITK